MRRRTRKHEGERGGIVLETAIVLPLFMALMIALLAMIQVVRTELALQRAVTETAKQVAAYAYPLKELSEQDVLERFGEIGDSLRQVWLAVDDKTKEQALQPLLKAAFLPLLKNNADGHLLREEGLEIVHVTLPSLSDPNRAYFVLAADYTLTLFIPFFHPEIRFHKVAKERIWIGG